MVSLSATLSLEVKPGVHTQSDSALWKRMNIASKHVFGSVFPLKERESHSVTSSTSLFEHFCVIYVLLGEL